MIRWLASWTSAILLGLIVVAPLAAMVVAAGLDRGPDGAIRAAIFPAAITALDPFVWACVQNSVLMAGAVAVASLLAGIGLGRTLGEWRFPFRRLVVAMLTVVAATPPAVIALGLMALMGGSGGETAWRGWADRVGGVDELVPLYWEWIGWFLAAVAPGGALATLAYLAAGERLDPAWRDAARLAGGSRHRVWRRLSWPILRPAMARACGLVFMATLADPGAPLILGLRRTLGYQMVVAAVGPEPFPRLAALGLIVLICCAIVYMITFVWRGADRPGGHQTQPDRLAPPASWRRTLGAGLLGVGWTLVPAVAILALVVGASRSGSMSRVGIHDPVVVALAGRSVVLGLAVAIAAAVARRVVAGLQSAAAGASADRFEAFARLGTASPTLAGVVALCVPYLASVAADAMGGRSLVLNGLAGWLNGAGAALPLLVFGVWLATAPLWLVASDRRRAPVEDSRVVAAELAGAGRRRAHWLARSASGLARPRPAAVVAILAATNIAPAVLLVASVKDSTLGPAVLLLHEQPGDGLATACALALVIFALSAAAALARRRG